MPARALTVKWWGILGNHGCLLFPEPGTRAPDTDERKTASVNDTVSVLKDYLKLWCRHCADCIPETPGGYDGFSK